MNLLLPFPPDTVSHSWSWECDIFIIICMNLHIKMRLKNSEFLSGEYTARSKEWKRWQHTGCSMDLNVTVLKFDQRWHLEANNFRETCHLKVAFIEARIFKKMLKKFSPKCVDNTNMCSGFHWQFQTRASNSQCDLHTLIQSVWVLSHQC